MALSAVSHHWLDMGMWPDQLPGKKRKLSFRHHCIDEEKDWRTKGQNVDFSDFLATEKKCKDF